MTFAHPGWLPVAVLACAAMLWAWRRHDARRRAALQRFIAPHLQDQLTQSVSRTRVLLKRALFAVSIALLFVALAEPQAGFRWEQVKRRGNDIIFAVDTSRSMTTPDVKPNRLERAKLAIDDFVDKLDGDAVGLVAFAGTAFLQTPVTLDYQAFHESLAALDTHIIPRGGTNITSAIREAQAALHGRPGSDKILILVTDGEDLEGDAVAAAKAAATQGLKIFTVGVGSANGDLIPLPPDQGGGFLRDRDGHLVKSHLDESALKAISAATGGTYAPLGPEDQGLDSIYRQAIAPLAKHDLESRSLKVYTQKFQWPLGAGILALLGSLMISTRRRRSSVSNSAEPERALSRLAVPSLVALVGLGGLLPPKSANASPASAATAYQHGDFAKAQQDYAAAAAHDPKQPLLAFDAGAAAYKAGQFPQAAEAFQASVNATTSADARRLADQEDGYYNLGNTLYREGQKTERSDPQATIDTWTRAVKSYDAALKLRADDADDKFNRDLVSRKLEALKKSQSQKNPSAQNQPKQSSQEPKPRQGKDQSSKDNTGSSTSQQQAAQPKQPAGAKPQSGQSGQQQAGQPNEQPRQAEQNSGTTPGKNLANEGQSPQPGENASAKGGGSLPQPDRKRDASGSQSEKMEQAGQMAQAGDDQRAPGEMSRQEARQLLDSVKDEERRAPGAPMARNDTNSTSSDEPLKDW